MTNDYFYRTGDLCRWLDDGNIEFLGRIDGQIKLRGFRIELSEIESRLSTHNQVKEAVVVLKEKNSQPYLCAYFVTAHEAPVSLIREYLSGVLPNYMIPSHFVPLDKLPLTPNGKVDRRALPEPEIETNQNFEAPVNEIDWRLAEIWSDVLGIDRGKISIHDDFFQLGGHSLKAAVLTAHIHKVFNAKIQLIDVFTNPILKNLSQHIKETTKDMFRAVNNAEKKEYYPLTSAQERLFVLQQMDPGNTTYNIPAAFTVAYDKESQPDRQTLANTVRKIINRHESLRTSFLIINDEPVQRIHEKVEFEIEILQELGNLAKFIRPFDLSKAPLLRMGLIKLAEQEFILILDMHHIIADGASLNIFAGEFMALHNGTELPALKIHYKDFALWHRNFLETGKITNQENYWLKQFDGEIPTLNLLTDFPRPKVQSFAGNTLTFEIGNGCKEALYALARKEGVTLYMLILAMINILFAKLGRQDDIIVGMPTAGRRHTDLQPLIGMFVNTLALRNFPLAHKTLREFIGEVKKQTLDAFENQEYPFEDLVEKVVVNRDPGRNPLFDVMFVLQNTETVEIEIPGLKLKPFEIPNQISKFDLTLIAVENGPKILFTIEYCTSLFKEETIKRFTRYLKKLLLSVLGKPGRKIREIEIIPGEERRRILYDFNKTACEYPQGKTIHSLVAEQAEKIPEAAAVVFSHGRQRRTRTNTDNLCITYRELHERSNHLAGVLIDKGVLPDNIIGIKIERSVEMIIALLGVLKAGCIYLPIDPNYPQERINYMLKDSNAAILLTNEKEINCQCSIVNCQLSMKVPPVHHHSSFIIHHSKFAYIIYTSGTTGQPKGVLIKHEGFVNLIYYHQLVFGEGPGIKMSQVANPGFDAMAFEVWPCLANGATLYIVDEETRLDHARMKQWLIKKEIKITFQPTIMAEQLLDEIWPDQGVALKMLMTAGDKLTRFPAQTYPFQLYNLYGPTEDTVWTTWTEVPVKPDGGGFPSIGKPIGNHCVYITGPNLELLPIRVPGEICIEGAGLSVGYLNNPEKTAEKFINFHRSSFIVHHSNLYRTGDLARWLDDGNIEFLGRIDSQVKLRGFRIELGEIESRLIAYPGIKEAIVVLKEKNHQSYLCAYYISAGEITASILREYLNSVLPAYMVPSYFVAMERFPLTPNGKINLRALPEPVIKTKESYEGPTNFIEEKLIEIWQDVLDVKGIGVYDNFFELGGDSIKGVQIVSRLQKYNLKMEVANLFLHSTIKEVAASIKKITRLVSQETVTGLVELTPIQQWFFENNFNNPHHFNQAVMIYSETGFAESIVRYVFQEIVEHHDALRMVFAKKNLQVFPHNRGLDTLEGKLFNLKVFDFQNEPDAAKKIENEAGHLQASIDLENGPLVHLGLFKTDKGDHLLIIVHHLVIDGVSWRILLEDFAAGYSQALKG
ncbi:MAG: amino acid adenylation domain-containing protein, partial [Acidobacteria bacterium]|nr:amino acid adenylation domain-containing protein [Acidobacteriota bacterium]